MEGDDADRCGADLDALEEIERRAQIVRQAGAQDIAVGIDGNDFTCVLCADALQGCNDAVLHLSQRFSAWKSKAAREDLHQFPLRSFAQLLQLAAAPVAVVDFQDAGLDGDGQVQRRGQWLGRLQAAQERAGIDGGNWLNFETLGNLIGLLLSLLVQRNGGCASGQCAPFCPFVFAVANQEEIGRALGGFVFVLVIGLAFGFVFGCVRLLCCFIFFLDQTGLSLQGDEFPLV